MHFIWATKKPDWNADNCNLTPAHVHLPSSLVSLARPLPPHHSYILTTLVREEGQGDDVSIIIMKERKRLASYPPRYILNIYNTYIHTCHHHQTLHVRIYRQSHTVNVWTVYITLKHCNIENESRLGWFCNDWYTVALNTHYLQCVHYLHWLSQYSQWVEMHAYE